MLTLGWSGGFPGCLALGCGAGAAHACCYCYVATAKWSGADGLESDGQSCACQVSALARQNKIAEVMPTHASPLVRVPTGFCLSSGQLKISKSVSFTSDVVTFQTLLLHLVCCE